MQCPICGRLNRPNAKFCGNCGRAMPSPLPQVVQPGIQWQQTAPVSQAAINVVTSVKRCRDLVDSLDNWGWFARKARGADYEVMYSKLKELKDLGDRLIQKVFSSYRDYQEILQVTKQQWSIEEKKMILFYEAMARMQPLWVSSFPQIPQLPTTLVRSVAEIHTLMQANRQDLGALARQYNDKIREIRHWKNSSFWRSHKGLPSNKDLPDELDLSDLML